MIAEVTELPILQPDETPRERADAARNRARILAAAAAERTNVAPLPARRARPTRALAAVAAVAACAAIGLGVWAASLSRSLDAERSARATEARALAIYLDPDARRIALRGRDGTLAVDATGRGALVVRRLPAAPSDKTYEAWVIPAGADPVRAGVFRGGGDTTAVPLERRVPRGAVVAVTVERAGGVDAPTQSPVATAGT